MTPRRLLVVGGAVAAIAVAAVRDVALARAEYAGAQRTQEVQRTRDDRERRAVCRHRARSAVMVRVGHTPDELAIWWLPIGFLAGVGAVIAGEGSDLSWHVAFAAFSISIVAGALFGSVADSSTLRLPHAEVVDRAAALAAPQFALVAELAQTKATMFWSASRLVARNRALVASVSVLGDRSTAVVSSARARGTDPVTALVVAALEQRA